MSDMQLSKSQLSLSKMKNQWLLAHVGTCSSLSEFTQLNEHNSALDLKIFIHLLFATTKIIWNAGNFLTLIFFVNSSQFLPPKKDKPRFGATWSSKCQISVLLEVGSVFEKKNIWWIFWNYWWLFMDEGYNLRISLGRIGEKGEDNTGEFLFWEYLWVGNGFGSWWAACIDSRHMGMLGCTRFVWLQISQLTGTQIDKHVRCPRNTTRILTPSRSQLGKIGILWQDLRNIGEQVCNKHAIPWLADMCSFLVMKLDMFDIVSMQVVDASVAILNYF